jgi:PAS domain S-box-containing protein
MGRTTASSTSAEATLDALADPVLVCGPDGSLLYANAAASTLLGEPPEALVGRPAEELVPERLRTVDGARFFPWVAAAYREHGRPIRAPLLRPDGVEILQSFRVSTTTVEGVGTTVVAILRPPTDDHEVESDPLQLDGGHPAPERSYQAVFEAVPVGVLHFDSCGRITDCNDNFVQQMGAPSRAVLTGLDMLTLPNEGVRGAVRDALSGRDGHFEGEYVSVTGKRRRIYRALFSPIVREGRVEGGVGIVDDITDRRRIEERLSQGERMASLGRLAAGVAHEINNPLAYVRTSLDIARRELSRFREDGDQAHLERALDTLGHADDGVDRVRVIAHDLKTFSRGDDGSWVPVDLRRVAETAINLAWNEIRHRAELVRELDDVPRIMGSETRFAQVLVNLLVNAAQAIPEGDAHNNRITLRMGTQDEGRVFVEVEDTGSGMEAERIPHVFEPFWTSKPKGVGTGLGLSICHGIVTAAGGDIRVARSEPGLGTTFRIELPSALPAPRRTLEDLAPAPPVHVQRARILVVDDEPKLAATLRIGLGDLFDVEVCESGVDALSVLSGDRGFDLVLCDLMMPEMSGMDLFDRVSESDPELARRFVFMTGGAFTDRARRFLQDHRPRRLEKPFPLVEVERLLAEQDS